MRRFVRRVAALIVMPAAFAGMTLATTAAPSAAAVPAAYTRMQNEVIKLTNQQRAKYGCRALQYDSRLARAAILHSREMAQYGYFSHRGRNGSTFVTRARSAGYRYAMSENIAWGYPTAREVVIAWMRSPGHKRNIINCSAKRIGVGVAYHRTGFPYWTQEFGRV